MNFTDKQHDKLYKTYCNELEITIEGCNGFGLEFIATGKIASVMGDEIPELNAEPDEIYAGVFDNAVVLEFLDETKVDNYIRSKYSSAFYTSLEGEGAQLNNFLIKSIKVAQTDKILFENNKQEYESHLKKGMTRYLNYNINKAKIGAPIVDADDELFFNLFSSVGKPININGLSGVLFYADSKSKDGNIMIHYMDVMQFKTSVFSKNSEVKFEDGVIKIQSPNQMTIVSNREPNEEE